jgi:hypothetical protein
MRVPTNFRVFNAQIGALESADTDKQLGRTMRSAAHHKIEAAIDQTFDADITKADKEHDAEQGMNKFAKIGLVVGALALGAVSGGAALPLIAAAGATVMGAGLCVGVAAVAVVGAALGTLVARGIGGEVTKGDRDDAAAAARLSADEEVVKKSEQQFMEEVGKGALDRGKDNASAAYEQAMQIWNNS